MRSNHYTLLVLSDASPRTHKIRFPAWLVPRGVAALGLLGLGLLFASIHYFATAMEGARSRALLEENAQLRSDLKQVRERIAQIGATLDRVEQFDRKLRAAAQTPPGDSGVAALPEDPDAHSPSAQAMLAPPLAEGVAPAGDPLSAQAIRQGESLQEYRDYFEDQNTLLASSPSLWPTRGFVTSDFGIRLDPFTAERIGHQGLDIATTSGDPVIAPSDGVVIYAGAEGGYGNVVVLDHGHGIRSRYGHLSEIGVAQGQRVKRGERLGAVGSTGRSTGPHLHYEVRVNGIAENPRKFILE